MTQRGLAGIVAILLLPAGGAVADGAEAPAWKDVSAIFQVRCIMCHSDLGAASGLRLDSYEAAMRGSDDGAVLLPGNAAGSELIRRLRGESTPRMPFLSYPLPEEQIELITRWIDAGLPDLAAR